MNKSIIIAVAAVAVIALGGLGLVLNGNSKSDSTTQKTSTTNSGVNGDSMENMNTTSTQPESTEAVETNVVDIKDFSFVPSKIKVKKGTTVTWTNQDSIRHDINPDKDSDIFKASELLAKGETYSVTFDTVGTYTYHCTPHPYMKGSVEVVE
jgi:amicyanin